MPLLSPYDGMHFFVGRATDGRLRDTSHDLSNNLSNPLTAPHLISLLPAFSSYQLLNYLPHLAQYNRSFNSKKMRRSFTLSLSACVFLISDRLHIIKEQYFNG